MTTIVVETRITAPVEVCFDLARDVEAHLKMSSSTGERAVGGKTSGLLDLGDVVTFEAVHFGLRQRLTSMRDTLTWRSPLGFLGVVADKVFVERQMREFMVKKQSELKEYAERTTGGAG
jgi:hypothetical protein